MRYIDRRLSITDLETTGTNPRYCEILEVGLVITDRITKQIHGTFESKVRPTFSRIIEPEEEADFDFRSLARGEKIAFRKALEINGYVPDEWRDAPDLATVLEEYARRTPETVFTSHNTTFDWGFMDVAFEETGVRHQMDYHRPDLFTRASELLYARAIELSRYNLKSLAQALEIPPEPEPHRAMQGAMTAYEIFKAL